jgi:hypothetical protein
MSCARIFFKNGEQRTFASPQIRVLHFKDKTLTLRVNNRRQALENVSRVQFI